jgi:hypothetical protein
LRDHPRREGLEDLIHRRLELGSVHVEIQSGPAHRESTVHRPFTFLSGGRSHGPTGSVPARK